MMDNIQFQRLIARQRSRLMTESHLEFHGHRFDIHVAETTKKGHTFRQEVVVHPGAVVILPLLDVESVIMIQNERFAVGETLWELPAGTIEPNEPPEITAARELVEETGYRASEIVPLNSFYTSPGFCNEAMYAYVARDIHFVGQHLDQNEQISAKEIRWTELLEMLKYGQIRDAKTIATLLYFYNFNF